ncbi:MAG: hypothetical protein JJLCMIEE_00046 [Acidimicrobiales bacterium]|nr:hypothetical protein [Acidimicrobiales bacterium]
MSRRCQTGHHVAVDVTADLDTGVSVERLFRQVEVLDGYPDWLEIVVRAVPAGPNGADEGPAWMVDLRGKLGPLARSKRLRMVRTRHEPPRLVVFERREVDRRDHSPWVLRAEVGEVDGGSRLTMQLHYGGTLWGPVIERLLRDAIQDSRARLLRVLQQAS